MSQEKSEDQERIFQCPKCPRRFDTLHALRIHFKKKHKRDNRCLICGREYRNLFKHYQNMAIHTQDPRYITAYVLMAKKTNKIPDEWIEIAMERLAVK